MKKPIIGITAGITQEETGMMLGYRRSYVAEDYVKVIEKCGGVPFILPVVSNPEVIATFAEKIDGLLLSGGNDIDPCYYQEEPQQKLQTTLSERDAFEWELLKVVRQRRRPILGICRGFQLINIFYQGSLYQDLSYRLEKTYRHDQQTNPSQATHQVKISPFSRLYEIFQKETLRVNSFHHQILKEVKAPLKVSATALDGVVEAIEDPTYPYLIGLQWHPEMLAKTKEQRSILLFQDFIFACQR